MGRGRAQRLADEPLPVKEGDVTSVAFSPDGKTIAAGYDGASGGVGGGVVLWDAAGANRLTDEPLPVKEGDVSERGLQPRRQDHRRRIRRHSAARRRRGAVGRGRAQSPGGGTAPREGGRRQRAWPSAPTARPSPPDTSGVGAASAAWCCGTRPVETRLADEPLAVSRRAKLRSVAFSPDGKTLAAGYATLDGGVGGVVLWDAAERNRLTDEPLDVKEGDVSERGLQPRRQDPRRRMSGAVGSVGGGVVLWDVAGGNRLTKEPLAVKEGYVSGVAFSPDGKTIAAGYRSVIAGGGVVVWGAAGGNRLTNEPLDRQGGLR